jgi:hypothetical protein
MEGFKVIDAKLWLSDEDLLVLNEYMEIKEGMDRNLALSILISSAIDAAKTINARATARAKAEVEKEEAK